MCRMTMADRLHKAADHIAKGTRGHISHQEDNSDARGPRDRALGHIDAALHATGTGDS